MKPALRLTGVMLMMDPDETATPRENIMLTLATTFIITSLALVLALSLENSHVS
jgi:hypothetical protein